MCLVVNWLDVNSWCYCTDLYAAAHICVFHPHSRVHMLKNTLPHCAFFHTKTFSVLVTDCTWSAVDVVPWITLSFFYSFIYFNFEQWRRSETLLFQPGHSLTLMAPNTPGSLSNETGSLLTVMSWMHPTKADVTGSAVCIVVSAVQAGQGCVIVVLWHIDFCHFCLILSLGSSSIRSVWWRHSPFSLYLTSDVMSEFIHRKLSS